MTKYLWYEYTNGVKNKPILCFLHGGAGSSSVFENSKRYFKKQGYPILMIDLAGHGYSRNFAATSFNFIDQAKQVNEVILKKNIENFILIGHCMGGMIAQVYYNLYPKKVDKLILISTHWNPCKNLSTKGGIYSMILILKLLRKIGIYNNSEAAHDDYKKYKNTGDISLKRFFSSDAKFTSIDAFISYYREICKFDNTDKLTQINVPTLLIHGSKDMMIPCKDAYLFKEYIKNSTLKIIRHADHLIPFKDYSEMNKLIHGFVRTSRTRT